MRFLFLLLWWSSLSAWAQADILQFAEQLRTFQAHFVQETPRGDDELMGIEIRTGRVALQRPGKLYWHYAKGDGHAPQTLVVDGRALWVWDPELDQVSVQPIEKVIKDIPLNWLLYPLPLQDQFHVRLLGKGDQGLWWFSLTPKRETFFQSMEVGLTDDNVLKAIHFYQSVDRVTRLKFDQVRVNGPVPAHLFIFSIPEGADLVGELPK